MLYLVGTPIGNMKDISARAVEVLGQADLIACEDTRRTGLLLKELGISGKLISYHEHNKASRGPVIIERLKEGLNVCLVSDAGMPSISDPGEDLVKLCIEAGIEVSAVPGPVAAITALVLSGLDTRYYHFEGFLPSEGKGRRARIEALRGIRETMVIYEAPHRLMKLISELKDAGFGECPAAFCRELTKKYEEVLRMTPAEAERYFTETPPKGEFVICLSPLSQEGGSGDGLISDEELDELIRKHLEEGRSTKEIASLLAPLTGRSKKELYSYIAKLH
ncbi:16S rRNA (cytidine1402-2'-O)-methyltransferase [Ruminococcaceae bacterium YRB3002]|nr:16S rRNA (cytidine1402-2'-O)-methyltransferase [Ruminococcaceae bacterium YRB3002]